MADIIMDVCFSCDFVGVFHVLKRAELVGDVDGDVVDEGITITWSVQGQLIITGEAIGFGIFVVVEQSACVQTLYQIENVLFDIVHDNVHYICIQKPI
jgi:ABC-type Mn2+/Zn2+ transport system permease subunit